MNAPKLADRLAVAGRSIVYRPEATSGTVYESGLRPRRSVHHRVTREGAYLRLWIADGYGADGAPFWRAIPWQRGRELGIDLEWFAEHMNLPQAYWQSRGVSFEELTRAIALECGLERTCPPGFSYDTITTDHRGFFLSGTMHGAAFPEIVPEA